MIVEIDERMFTKCKNNEEQTTTTQWIFGAICHEMNEFFLVLNRSMIIILEAIKENYIKKKGSITHFYSWKSYCTEKLEEESLENFKVTH